ncbi:glutamine-hydrolyzing GMP synthase [Candidatus Albibeggiatoa sp. nov. BB20]|uniref:glutamine-hydrolyzing GMP synthase n=1 Tax=Candidatus Albibeggiatoa sp. nov. BB20 TaxID=3162723 RepID=UPI0033657981
MMQDIHAHRILILDFGSQYTQLIARRVREARVYCEIYPYDVDLQAIQDFKPKGIILSGSPESVNDCDVSYQAPQAIFDMGVPILGICYGMQTMAKQLGGIVGAAGSREFGYAQVRAHGHSELLKHIEDHISPSGHGLLDVWMSHGDQVTELPDGFKLIASTDNAPIAGIADEQRHFYGLQFHPEVTHTTQGVRILKRFCHDVCGCQQLWSPSNIISDSIQNIKQMVGNDHVILALSGGVDSSVVAALVNEAIGKQLTCVFVNNGLLRLNEAEQVENTFKQNLGIKLIVVDAEKRFLDALKGITDPEQKRKIIGNLFIEIFDEEAAKISNAKWLAQGTIYPDVIESAGSKTGKAHVIKSHHNVGGLPDDMHLNLLEPLRELFKDEVRKLGIELGLPKEVVMRHPFPGPGLGVRILGEVKYEFAETLRQADAIFMEELRKQGWYEKVSQAFAVFLPVKSVGVVGDARQYDYVVALRAVQTVDFMTAHWAHLPYDMLETLSNRIINEVRGVSRVTYDISGKPPATIEWE